MYSLKYNPQYGRASSEIWIETFSGKGFYQIIDVNSSIDQLQSVRSIPEPNCTVRTTLILLRCEGKLYDPFEYDTKEGTIFLLGVKDYQYSIGEYNAMTYNDDLLIIEDQDGEEALILIPKSSIPTPEACDVRYDWISEKTLIDSFIDSLRTENSYTREQVRQLKDTVQQLIESGGNVQFTEERIAKIQTLLQDVDRKEACVKSIVQYALADDNIKQSLAEEIASNYFDQIQNKVVEISSVQKRVDELKIQEAALQKNVASLQESTETTKETESEEDSKKISELAQELERMRAENKALSEKVGLHEEIDKLTAERDQLKSDRDKAKDSYNQQLIDNNELQKQFDSTLKTFNDKATQTARILDSKLLDKILRGIGEEPPIEDPVSFDSTLLHTESMDYVDIIGRVSNGHISVTLYYQPVISSYCFENGVTLYRTTTQKSYYTPDFILKFAISEHDEEYVILDAKFSSRQSIRDHHLPDVIRKYSCEMGVAAEVPFPKMVWVLQGRVNSNENPIWRYHNSPLSARYHPNTSYGIVSVNTAVEVKQRLWNEIRNNISLLK